MSFLCCTSVTNHNKKQKKRKRKKKVILFSRKGQLCISNFVFHFSLTYKLLFCFFVFFKGNSFTLMFQKTHSSCCFCLVFHVPEPLLGLLPPVSADQL